MNAEKDCLKVLVDKMWRHWITKIRLRECTCRQNAEGAPLSQRKNMESQFYYSNLLVLKSASQCGNIVLCKGTKVKLGLILGMPLRRRNVLEAHLLLSCLQQEMSPDANSRGQFLLIKKSSPQSNPNFKNPVLCITTLTIPTKYFILWK